MGGSQSQLKRFFKFFTKTVEDLGFELYLHPKQTSGGVRGYDLERYLHKDGLFSRCRGLEDEKVQSWIVNPYSYPEELKGKVVFLWKTTRGFGNKREVAYLIWYEGRVIVDWCRLDLEWDDYLPALMASA
ncbi:MAG: hypothetical protein WD897_00170 [Parcubacteria group bacterium]